MDPRDFPHLSRWSRAATAPSPLAQWSDQQLLDELARLGVMWDRARADPDGHGGSPGEWLFERLGQLETEQARRSKTCPTCKKALRRSTSPHKCRHGSWCRRFHDEPPQLPTRSRHCQQCNDQFNVDHRLALRATRAADRPVVHRAVDARFPIAVAVCGADVNPLAIPQEITFGDSRVTCSQCKRGGR